MVTRVKSFDGSRKANTTAIVAYTINEGKMKKSIRLYSLISMSLLMLACSQNEEDVQAKSERISQEYQKQVEAEEKAAEAASTFKLPPRPEDTPEPIGPPPNVDEMTNPELVAKELASKDVQQRLAAVKRLGFLSAQSKIPDVALQRLINIFNADTDASVVDAAATALGQTCHPAAMLILFNNLQRRIADVNIAAVVVLGDSIVEISDNDPNFLQRLQEEKSAVESRIAAVEARAESFKARIKALEASMDNGISAAKSRTRMSGDRVDAALHAVEAAESVYKTASLNLKRQKSLASSGLASTRASLQLFNTKKLPPMNFINGAGYGTRTRNLLITNQLLYQLS